MKQTFTKYLYQRAYIWNDDIEFTLLDIPDMEACSDRNSCWLLLKEVEIEVEFAPLPMSKDAMMIHGLNASLKALRAEFNKRQAEILQQISEYQAITLEKNDDNSPF